MPPKKRRKESDGGGGGNGFGAPGLDRKKWKQGAVLKILEAMNLNPSGAAKTKFLVDAWKEEFGVGTEIDFLFLCMDGAPIYEILKMAEEDGADYTWIVAVRYRLHEIMTDQKAFVGVYWKSDRTNCNACWLQESKGVAHCLQYPQAPRCIACDVSIVQYDVRVA
jgi:hypothetical protein